MEKIISFDKNGRLYLPEDMRRFLQVRTLIAKKVGGTIVLEPIEEDPILALGKLGEKKLKGKSIMELKKQARIQMGEDAVKKIRRL